MSNIITSKDVEKIYQKVEKTKKGTFFIDKNEKEITPNHIDNEVVDFLSNKKYKNTLSDDSKMLKNILEGVI
ncbi:hypothetical protein [Aliarcobacter butzleri]|uniref:hypothetical protein n=1 Tax=Aliarcobacter butzleri TaxID=28197 RepID=UPI0021B161EF|nr:hypothetical protein [Aliarcobacter butzleri]MCT7553816.1 hypothetical protein [Aliarcobacter butzleri]MCT7571127.1 hypothetical protein [Aliarcobacter butzleri]